MWAAQSPSANTISKRELTTLAVRDNMVSKENSCRGIRNRIRGCRRPEQLGTTAAFRIFLPDLGRKTNRDAVTYNLVEISGPSACLERRLLSK